MTERAVSALASIQIGVGFALSMVATAGTIVTTDYRTAMMLLMGAFIIMTCVIFVIPRVFSGARRTLGMKGRIYITVVAAYCAFYVVTFEACTELGFPIGTPFCFF
ncbi:MAG TPA: hypothetical protein VK503_08135 [Candidatus Bathyarchaeia archaeon]|nr:hypothetical protein [Candidatus Bathyarchaeia archaeon]